MLRVASAGMLTLVALLLCAGAELSPPRAHDVTDALAIASVLTHDGGPAVAAGHRLTSTKAAQSAHVGGRHQPLVRSRAGEGDGDPAPTVALAAVRAEPFGNLAKLARSHLRWLALGHAPYGEPSPFDATAPPVSSPRNG